MVERRFTVRSCLGSGTLGTVYEALLEQDDLHQPVALKILKDGVNLDKLRAQLPTIRVDCPQMSPIAGPVQLNGSRWGIYSELAAGQNLRQLCKSEGVIPRGIAIQIVGALAEGLACAHDQLGGKGSHGDLKPSNVILAPNGELRILDYRLHWDPTSVAATPGDIGYLSPQRLDGHHDPNADVYALGALVVELLMGTPLSRTTPNRQRHQEGIAQAVGALGDLLRHESPLKVLLSRCLAYQLDERPSLNEVVATCHEMLSGTVGILVLHRWAGDVVDAAPHRVDAPSGGFAEGEVLEDTSPEDTAEQSIDLPRLQPVPLRTDEVWAPKPLPALSIEDVRKAPDLDSLPDGPTALGEAVDDPETVPSQDVMPSPDEHTDPRGMATLIDVEEQAESSGHHSTDFGKDEDTEVTVTPFVPPHSEQGGDGLEPKKRWTWPILALGALGAIVFVVLSFNQGDSSADNGQPDRGAALNKPPADPPAPQGDPEDAVGLVQINNPEPKPTPPPEPAAPEAPVQTMPVETMPVETAPARVAPPRRPSKPKAARTPTAPRTARVSWTGPAQSVRLSGASIHGLPASVPPGTYQVLASFPGESSDLVVGQLEVVAGEAITLKCDDAFLMCAP